jgi:tagatose 6-phosphate kinase
MIVTVTPNPALDLTYSVDALVPHRVHRVAAVAERAGGKGVNVARVLHAIGEPVLATGFLGGATGGRVTDLLTADGVAASFTATAAETRRTVAVVDGGDATGFWEPGPPVSAAEWSALVAHLGDLLAEADVVALCGSLPPGAPIDGYATLIRLAAAAGVPTVLDTSGEALRRGLAAGPTLAKPNAAELTALLAGGDSAADLADTARALAPDAGAVVVSRGALGLLAVTGDGVWAAGPPVPLPGNPTGAGDACVAALARGLRDRTAWPALLADAVALAAAAVAAPVAGAIDSDVYLRTLPRVTVTTADGGPRARTHR